GETRPESSQQVLRPSEVRFLKALSESVTKLEKTADAFVEELSPAATPPDAGEPIASRMTLLPATLIRPVTAKELARIAPKNALELLTRVIEQEMVRVLGESNDETAPVDNRYLKLLQDTSDKLITFHRSSER